VASNSESDGKIARIAGIGRNGALNNGVVKS